MARREDEAQTTVYPRNARAGARDRRCQPGWAPAIASLVERDFAFLPLSYGPAGFLFRGLEQGLGGMLDSGQLTRNEGDHALARLERETGVLFVSQDPADALAVSRLWLAPDDGGILVVPATQFALAHGAGEAAWASVCIVAPSYGPAKANEPP